MPCVQCETLQRDLREAREELAEWRARERDDGPSETRLEAWCTALDLRPRATAMIMVMADRPDRVCKPHFLLSATLRKDRYVDAGRASEQNLVAAHLSQARRRLRAIGLPYVLQTAWTGGYRISRADAQRLKALVGEAAA